MLQCLFVNAAFFLTVALVVKLIAEAYECCEADMTVDLEFGASETCLIK